MIVSRKSDPLYDKFKELVREFVRETGTKPNLAIIPANYTYLQTTGLVDRLNHKGWIVVPSYGVSTPLVLKTPMYDVHMSCLKPEDDSDDEIPF